jgi:uncharacterized protein YbjT (DUF2867 family)
MGDATEGLTVVLGGTGRTGRRVVERLRARDLPVRVGSRAGDPPFDWNDRATWAPALEGAASAYVTYVPDLAVPGAPETVGTLAELAVARGVRRLVLLSGRGEAEAERAERAVAAAGAEWTVLRSSWFDQNFSESFLLEPVLAGEVALPVDRVTEPFVDVEDIADVAVAALTEDGHAGQVYELTGPRLLRFEEAVEEISRASGRSIRFVPLSAERFASALADEGLPDDAVWLLTYLFAEVLDGRNARLGDGVQRALGREPRDFADFARRTAATGVWRAGARSEAERAGKG